MVEQRESWRGVTKALSEGEICWGFVRGHDSLEWMIELTLVRADGSVRSVRVPDRWHGNFGGSVLVVTPEESHAVLYVYSGQSEAECMVFRLVPELEFRVALPVDYEPVCSPDARYVAGLADGRGFAIDDPDREWWDPPEGAKPVFELGRLEIFELTTGAHQSHLLRLVFRREQLTELTGVDGDLEQWAYDNLFQPELELGRDGRGAVVTGLDRFMFTVPEPGATSMIFPVWVYGTTRPAG